MNWRFCHHVTITGFFVLVSLPRASSGNDGMPSGIHQLVQQQQDVHVVLEIWENGEPGLEFDYSLFRQDSTNEETVVFENRRFTLAEAEQIPEMTCRWWDDMEYMCEYSKGVAADRSSDVDTDTDSVNPYCDDCNQDGRLDCWGECSGSICIPCAKGGCTDDCDGDGANDCNGWCHRPLLFRVVDACVAPGATTYFFPDGHPYTATIDVVDSGLVCDPDTDAGPIGDESDGHSGGCNNAVVSRRLNTTSFVHLLATVLAQVAP